MLEILIDTNINTRSNQTRTFHLHDLPQYSVPEIRFVLTFFGCQPDETKYQYFFLNNRTTKSCYVRHNLDVPDFIQNQIQHSLPQFL